MYPHIEFVHPPYDNHSVWASYPLLFDPWSEISNGGWPEAELGEIIGGQGSKKFAYIGVNRQLIVFWILWFNITAPKVPFLEKFKEKLHF